MGSRDKRSDPGLDIRQLRALVALADCHSLTVAAQSLRVAQSTISEALSALERGLGTRVVARRRGTRGVTLTRAGEALLPHARSILAAVEDARVAVAEVARDVRGGINIIANESISTYLLPSALARVRPRWPNLSFAVMVGMCPSITDGLTSGKYDLGLMLQTLSCTEARSRKAATSQASLILNEYPLVLFSRNDHPLGAVPHTIFISDARGHFYETVLEFFRNGGSQPVRLEPAGSVEAVKRCVASNSGLGVLPSYALSAELRSGQFRAVPVKPAMPIVRLEAMFYRTRPPAHPALAELMDVLREAMQP